MTGQSHALRIGILTDPLEMEERQVLEGSHCLLSDNINGSVGRQCNIQNENSMIAAILQDQKHKPASCSTTKLP